MSRNRRIAIWIAAALGVLCAVPALPQAYSALTTTLQNNFRLQGGNLQFQTRSLTGQGAWGNVTSITVPNPAAARTITIPDAGGNSTAVLTTGAANGIVAKAKEFGTGFGPQSAALTDSTTYTVVMAPGRAGVVQKISIACRVVPAGATCTMAIKKNNGNTMLSTATFDLTTLVADTITAGTLTATTADLTLTATDTITCSVVTGATSTDIQAPTVTVEMLPNDY